jgi:hypothetical protein
LGPLAKALAAPRPKARIAAPVKTTYRIMFPLLD